MDALALGAPRLRGARSDMHLAVFAAIASVLGVGAQADVKDHIVPHLVKHKIVDGAQHGTGGSAHHMHFERIGTGGYSSADPNSGLRTLSSETMLRQAAWAGDEKAVHTLLQRGQVDINEPGPDPDDNSKMCTALMAAAKEGHNGVVSLLIRHGADTSMASGDGDTALIFTAQEGRTSTAELLLEAGVLLNHQNGAKRTALHEAALSKYGYGVLSVLLGNGARTDIQDAQGKTALIIAVEANDIWLVERLLTEEVDTSIKDHTGRNALDIASALNFQEVVWLLDEAGARPSAMAASSAAKDIKIDVEPPEPAAIATDPPSTISAASSLHEEL